MNEHTGILRKRATYQDVIDAPAHMVAELIGGTLHLHPRPASPHALAASSLVAELGMAFHKGRNGPGGWWIILEPELHVGSDVLVPDIAGWRRERMRAYPDAPWFDLAPDWVCEVLSPGTRRIDLTDKRDLYARAGVAHLWLVDPRARTLEAFRLDAGHWVLATALKDDESVNVPPFDAISFPLSELWPD
jgi:Uma2 family endonuclease